MEIRKGKLVILNLAWAERITDDKIKEDLMRRLTGDQARRDDRR